MHIYLHAKKYVKSQNIFLFKTVGLKFAAYQCFNGRFIQILNNDDMNAQIKQFSYISLYQSLISLYIYNFFVRCKYVIRYVRRFGKNGGLLRIYYCEKKVFTLSNGTETGAED